MDFLYDESGNAYSFVYNGTQYYYVRNLQGDIVKILNTSGTTVVAYSYDAWGKCTSTLISGLTQKINGSTTDSYTYTYDSLGNITAINRSGYEPISYTYDAQNQLTKVIEGDFRYEYAYDTYGNILSVKTYDNEELTAITKKFGQIIALPRSSAGRKRNPIHQRRGISEKSIKKNLGYRHIRRIPRFSLLDY
jgi:YD repeat-containing protein